MEREEGFYWVKYFDTSEWEIMQYKYSKPDQKYMWHMIGAKEPVREGVEVVDENRIFRKV